MKVLVIGDEFACHFYSMYKNVLANGRLPKGEDEINMHVQVVTFPDPSKTSIHNIDHVLGCYKFPKDTDVVLIALLHCDILSFNFQSGFCWAPTEFKHSNLTDICAKYATLHKWILDKIEGHDRLVTIQLLMPPTFYFAHFNDHFHKYLDDASANNKPLNPGETHLTELESIEKVNEVHRALIAKLLWFKNHWADYNSELTMLDVNECIGKAYILSDVDLPQEENLVRHYYVISEGRSPTDHPVNRYSPFSKDGIIPSHDGVVYILRQANKNHNKNIPARLKYPNLCSRNSSVYHDSITAHYPSESCDLVHSLSNDWSNIIAQESFLFKTEHNVDYPVLDLRSDNQIPVRPFWRERLE